VAVTEDHTSIHHGRQASQYSTPAVALNVNEAQQLWVIDVLACYIPGVGG
jgi:hypothetical protein